MHGGGKALRREMGYDKMSGDQNLQICYMGNVFLHLGGKTN
jgi:hypothetical protein